MSDDFKIVRIQNDRKDFPRGCHCDLNDGERPDECVFDLGLINDCSAAMQLAADGKGRDDCEHWRPETPQPKPVVITDEEREAVRYFAHIRPHIAGMTQLHAATLRGLLERLG
jgi:hypothetical protein